MTNVEIMHRELEKHAHMNKWCIVSRQTKDVVMIGTQEQVEHTYYAHNEPQDWRLTTVDSVLYVQRY